MNLRTRHIHHARLSNHQHRNYLTYYKYVLHCKFKEKFSDLEYLTEPRISYQRLVIFKNKLIPKAILQEIREVEQQPQADVF